MRMVELIDAELGVVRTARPVKSRRCGLSPDALVLSLAECQIAGAECCDDIEDVRADQAGDIPGGGCRRAREPVSRSGVLQFALDHLEYALQFLRVRGISAFSEVLMCGREVEPCWLAAKPARRCDALHCEQEGGREIIWATPVAKFGELVVGDDSDDPCLLGGRDRDRFGDGLIGLPQALRKGPALSVRGPHQPHFKPRLATTKADGRGHHPRTTDRFEEPVAGSA